MEKGRNGIVFALTVLIIFHHCEECTADGEDTLSLGASLGGNQTLISNSVTFALGFFSPNGTSNWYIGIWYAKLAQKTIVWVANRETPAKKRPGVFKLSTQGGLGLFDAEGTSLWSVNMSNKASRAVILDSGNFVVLSGGNKSEIVWQSFDHPFDTWLPGMKIGGKKKLVCWKNSLDPAPGLFSHQMDPSGIRQFVMRWNNSVQYYDSGAWDGKRFTHIPEMSLKGSFLYSVENTTSGFYISFALSPALKVLTRFVVQKYGVFQLYALFDNTTWSVTWSQPRDQCSVYNICGAYGSCTSKNVLSCSCIEGFVPRDNRSWSLQDWSSTGCIRQIPLNCDTRNGSSDGFLVSSVTLPDNQASSYPASTKKDCEKACLHNCSCTAFTFNPPSEPCQIWSGDFPSMRNSSSQSNSDIFIRLAASALVKFDHQRPSSKRKTTVSIVGAVLGVVAALAIALCIYSFFMWRRNRLRSMQMGADSSNSFLRMFSYR
ncbi:G-type lectin S-receptor-like serine/threonine-protein kinase At2g19130 [Cryptomeria japonica]|uniref:G-type lectin S-receptor-like serine/threonine-protein kinase At2g19130 n=1 Tax=Cryptomeria japonica TaxID=3369 RepID=UPI0027D9E87D|nr:G-type lectin S-receptor-like serine/threonine-protein kinase At2g19130 [Cryptomeria japonica]